ncbi:bacteriophage holin [Lentzea sp. CC55]|uniref:bacteriophage holin n=1 Tax=Lentzea sp. CC55 TaxID=2884909 RepID=UPI0027E0E331|nr:bacteriophage holin [Lentzea sp. CC55]MCG8923682.1 bacteriophage holin [Lentzea sp. CC55]
MPSTPTLALIALGLVVLVVIGVRVLRSLRRLARARTLVGDGVGNGVGLLKARSAALKVALAGRRPKEQARTRANPAYDRRGGGDRRITNG